MRDRLIELIKQVPYGVSVGAKFTQQFSEKMADNLLANGVIVPPCKVGDTVYVIATRHPCYACDFCDDFCHKDCRIKDKTKLVVKKATVCAIYIREEVKEIHVEFEKSKWLRAYMSTCYFDEYGKLIFLTREEAEKALAERSAE